MHFGDRAEIMATFKSSWTQTQYHYNAFTAKGTRQLALTILKNCGRTLCHKACQCQLWVGIEASALTLTSALDWVQHWREGGF